MARYESAFIVGSALSLCFCFWRHGPALCLPGYATSIYGGSFFSFSKKSLKTPGMIYAAQHFVVQPTPCPILHRRRFVDKAGHPTTHPITYP